MKGLQRIIHADDRLPISGLYETVPLLIYKSARTRLEARHDKIMSVESLTRYGDKQLTLLYGAGVDRKSCKPARPARNQRAAGRIENIIQSKHHALPLRRLLLRPR